MNFDPAQLATFARTAAIQARPGMTSWYAVVQCALDAGAFSWGRARQLWFMNWQNDFSDYVSNDDPLVGNAAQMRNVPAGAFLAFVSVGPPYTTVGGRRKGMRRLDHAMISLGGGRAVGMYNARAIGIGTDQTWEELDLATLLGWLPGGAEINGMPRNIKKLRLLRLRYHVVPQTQQDIIDAMVRAIDPQNLVVQFDVSTHQGGFIRPKFTFRVTPGIHHQFFNAAQGLRGRYFDSAANGDAFTQAVLTAIINKPGVIPAVMQAFHAAGAPGAGQAAQTAAWRNRLQQSFQDGKIWFVEWIGNTQTFDTDNLKEGWGTYGWEGQHYHPLSQRWTQANRPQNLANFLNEIHNLIQADPNPAAVNGVLTGKFNGAEGSDGQGFWAWGTSPRDNIDVKGNWVSTDLANAGTMATPPNKVGRGSQIKWFGYT